MSLRFDSAVPLLGGVQMPVLGLGTAGASGRTCVAAVRESLAIGYRLLDTASLYRNEREVGLGIRESGVPREAVFLTTKVATADQGRATTVRACQASLRRLSLEYVDLYLIHWPSRRKRLDTWRAMEDILRRRWARSIGVSNFMVRHLEELQSAGLPRPAVNQIELSPFLQQRDVVDYCRTHAIQVEAYSPLTQGRRLDDPAVASIARKHGRTQAQVLLRWSLQHGFVPIPKSVRPERIRENADVFDFELPPEDMRTLDALDRGLHFDRNPSEVP